MTAVNSILYNDIRTLSSKYLYCPDVMPYNREHFDKAFYDAQIALSKQPRVSTDGVTLKPVGRIRYAWEHIKGWFGFQNHCDSKMIALTTLKLKYFAYVCQLNSSEEISDTASTEKQRMLIDAYRNAPIADDPERSPRFIPCTYFGNTLGTLVKRTDLKTSIENLVAFLDVQHEGTINYVTSNSDLSSEVLLRMTHKGSTFGRAAAECLRRLAVGFGWGTPDDKKLKLSLEYDSSIQIREPQTYLLYHVRSQYYPKAAKLLLAINQDDKRLKLIKELTFEEHTHIALASKQADAMIQEANHAIALEQDQQAQRRSEQWFNKALRFFGYDANTDSILTQALAHAPSIADNRPLIYIDYYLRKKEFTKAIGLISKLSSKQAQLNCLLKIETNVFLEHVTKNSDLANILAQHYLSCNQLDEAEQFCDALDELDTVKTFELLVQKGEARYKDAWAIFSDHSNVILQKADPAHCKTLADFYNGQGEHKYEDGQVCRATNNLSGVLSAYQESAKLKHRAFALYENDYREEHFIHQRLVAQVMVEIELERKWEAAFSASNLAEAIQILRTCRPYSDNEQARLANVKAKAWMLYADKELDSIMPNDGELNAAHYQQHKKSFDTIVQRLKEITQFPVDMEDTEQQVLRGKAHFMLANLKYALDVLPGIESYEHHAMEAIEAAPKNPCYQHFVHQVTNEDSEGPYITESMRLFDESAAPFTLKNYTDWMDVRWYTHLEQIRFRGVSTDTLHQNCNHPPDPPSSWFRPFS